MADTAKVAHEVEQWIMENWMVKEFGHEFRRAKVMLTSGGEHTFSAVNNGTSIVACIITSEAKTPSSSRGTGKMNKVRSDLYYLLLTNAKRKVVIFTEPDMFDAWNKEAEVKRVPSCIEFKLAIITDKVLLNKLQETRQRASKEVTPIRGI